jgi:hypothetical protein
VEIDGNTKMSSGLKDREEARIVKKQAAGGAIEESAVEAEAGDAALQLRRCRGGSLQGKRSKSPKKGGMGAHRLGHFVIDVAGQRTCRIRIERIEAHRGERQHLEIDPGLVHVGDPAGTDVEEFGLEFRKLRGSFPVMRSGCSEEDSVTKCSSSVMVLMEDWTMPVRREFPDCGMRMAELDTDLIQSPSPQIHCRRLAAVIPEGSATPQETRHASARAAILSCAMKGILR